jgi:hypothetical protein
MSKSKTRSSRWKFQADELMFSVLCAVDCSYFAFAEIFGLRSFVLNDDLGLTLVLVFPFSGRISYSRSSLSIL